MLDARQYATADSKVAEHKPDDLENHESPIRTSSRQCFKAIEALADAMTQLEDRLMFIRLHEPAAKRTDTEAEESAVAASALRMDLDGYSKAIQLLCQRVHRLLEELEI